MSEIPPWLNVMRAITGTVESPGGADNPKIVGMADEIGRIFPDMQSYCDLYQHDETPWCGLAAAYCMAEAGIRPPYKKGSDTDSFLWAQAWASDPGYQPISSPRLGCVVVMTRSGGGHVTLYESDAGSNIKCRGGNQSDSVNVASYPKSSVIAYVWPSAAGPVPPAERRELSKGDTGSDVMALQTSLGIPADGDFGSITETQVKAFQAACGIVADGVVGPMTWDEVDALDAKMAAGSDGIPDDLAEAIAELAGESELADYSWPGRGRPPPGYIPGMAQAFALAVTGYFNDETSAFLMAQAETGNSDKDALTWLKAEFNALGMSNATDGLDTLRHLFVLLIGLGMRESSGKYCEGRDMSATNVTADTCEAGLFQTSWDIRSASAELPKLMIYYWKDPNGFLATFNDGVDPTANNLQVYGSGEGARYQFLAKYSPAFAVMTTAVGLRVLRQHWGPVNRKEVTLRREADEMLKAVQTLIEEVPIEPPEPPVVEEAEVSITIESKGKVKVTINGQVVVS